jgi:hypothetical protein
LIHTEYNIISGRDIIMLGNVFIRKV